MLDENLPTFFLKPSADKVKHHETYIFTQNGSEPESVYAVQHIDPASNAAKNTYALAMFDSYNPDILYGEVLAKPGWTHPTLSQEEIRKNGGVPPPPQPIFPTEFAIQLYNPDQQVMVRQQTTKWSGTVTWEFSLPQTTFRTPSSSSLDKSQGDPGADTTTPHLNFVWKKEGRIGKDMTCYLTGKSTDPTGKKAKKNKEPDIAVALFSGLKEMTIMESNQSRLELEDYKGLEVVLLLSAAVIRDLFFSNLKEIYHIIEPSSRKNSGGLRGRKGSSPQEPARVTPPVMTPQPPTPAQPPRPAQTPLQSGKGAPVTAIYNAPSSNNAKRSSLPPLQTGNQRMQRLDPRSQWEIDAETARLKAQVEAETREQKRQAELRRARQEQEAERKTRKLLEDEERRRKEEEKQRRRRQAEVDKETERLRKQFGDQSNLLPKGQANQRHSVHFAPSPSPWQTHRPAPTPAHPPRPKPAPVNQGPYLQAPGAHRPTASHSSFFSNGLPKPDAQAKMKKKSFWGLRTKSEEPSSTLKKKQSSMF